MNVAVSAWMLAAALGYATVGGTQELSMAEIEERIRELAPKPADCRFVAPSSWSINFATGRPLVTVVPASARGGSQSLVDEDGYTTWRKLPRQVDSAKGD